MWAHVIIAEVCNGDSVEFKRSSRFAIPLCFGSAATVECGLCVGGANASSNAEAAIIASKDSTVAAIAGDIAAKLYDISVLASGIEDERNNTTRFLIIGTDSYSASGEDKTSFMVSAPNKVGSLFELLKPLYDAGVDMSRIESRPSRQTNWEYVFYIDLIGHIDNPTVADAIEKLKAKSAFFKLIGSYPMGVL